VIDLSDPVRPTVVDSRKYTDIFRDSAGEDDAHDLVYRDGHLYVTGQTTHSLGILRLNDGRLQELTKGPASRVELTPAIRAALNRISAESLRGHVSFLASDLLEGRGTPSKGLDLAAEYIAAQFRRAGLEPLGDDGYFQTADWKYLAPDPGSFSCELTLGGETVRVTEGQVSGALTSGLDLQSAATLKVNARDSDALAALTAEAVKGKVVLAEVPHPYKVPRSQLAETSAARIAFLKRMEELGPALVISVDADEASARGLRQDLPLRFVGMRRTPMIQLHSPQLHEVFGKLAAGLSDLTITLHVGEPRVRSTKVRNIVGRLKGSDPELSETHVLLTAHYDHLGIAPHDGSGDRIYNGANDDASGVAAVIEAAAAAATLDSRPKRSLMFVAFYGEEHGMVGSAHFAANPVAPIERIVAAINLEQLGRTDDSEGPRVATADVTGFDYSGVAAAIRSAGAALGIEVSKRPQSDRYFAMSDNISLARVGIPAHTVSVAFGFPDYHGADDEWEKLDYANMAQVVRLTTLGLLTLANGPVPQWNEENPQTEPYRRPVAPPR
jgi:hypothetical protein